MQMMLYYLSDFEGFLFQKLTKETEIAIILLLTTMIYSIKFQSRFYLTKVHHNLSRRIMTVESKPVKT